MNEAQRKFLRRLREEAKPGEWRATGEDGDYPVLDRADQEVASGCDRANARLVAAAVNALVPLLDALDAAERERDEARGAAAVERVAIIGAIDAMRDGGLPEPSLDEALAERAMGEAGMTRAGRAGGG